MSLTDATSVNPRPPANRWISNPTRKLPAKKKTGAHRHKKARTENKSLFMPERFLVKASTHYDYNRAMSNVVFLSPELYSTIFSNKNALNNYITVANLVYRVSQERFLSDFQIDINFVSFDDIKSDWPNPEKDKSVWISRFDPLSTNVTAIEEATFFIYPHGTLNTFGDTSREHTVFTSSVEKLVRAALKEDILSLKQGFFIKHPVLGPMKAFLHSWKQKNINENAMLTEESIPYYGQLTEQTKLKVVSGNQNKLLLVDEFNEKNIKKFFFTIQQVQNISEKTFSTADQISQNQDAWKNDASPLPLIVPLYGLERIIRERLTGRLIQPGKVETFRHGPDWKFDLEFTKVKVVRNGKEADTQIQADEENPKLFRMNKNHPISVTTDSDVALSASYDNARDATALTFEIIDIESTRTFKENEIHWLSVQEATKEIKKMKLLLVIGSKVVLNFPQTKYLLKLNKAAGSGGSNLSDQSNLKEIWALTEDTEIRIYRKKRLDLEIVDTPQSYVLKSLTVKVSVSDDKNKTNLLALLNKKPKKDSKKTVVPKEEIEILFRQSLPHEGLLHEKQVFETITDKGDKIQFTVENIVLKDNELAKPYHGRLYQCLPNTKIALKGDKRTNLVISTKPQEINFYSIDEKLLELGIGGMSKQVKKIIARTFLSRSTFANHIKALGQKPSRGFLLYGPPGTGKTLLARELGKLFNISKGRTKLFTGSQVWKKWLGDSEKEVRNWFKEAREEWNEKGEESETHLLIFDEIEAALPKITGDSKQWEVSTVNTFKAELDGISSEGEDSLGNIIVIGITNHLDKIDDAILRPGRLNPHIHIGIPDAEGRKDIFQIHSKGIREGGFLADDVNIDELVKLSVGKTGAFIEGVVKTAAEYSLERLWEQQTSPDQIENHPAAKLHMDDFRKAVADCSHKREKIDSNPFIPSTLLQVEEVAQDLQALGLGGISMDALRFLCDLKISQKYKEFLCAMKHPFPRGAFLYGPPGTGKTSLAKALKRLFQLDDERFQYLQASELWPLQGQRLREKVEELLQPAKEAFKDLKQDAPFHVIVLDEIDKLYPHKRETDQYDLSAMNQVLMELDPLFEEDYDGINNLLVIGIAHRPPRELPEGILRHGRFGKHIEMKVSNEQGRRKIFEIYLKEYIVKNKLGKDVDIDKLVGMTRDRSGAFIEGLISEAIVRSIRRIATTSPAPDQIKSIVENELSNITMADFRGAYDDIKIDEKWKQYFL